MPANLQAYKVAHLELSSNTKQDNMIQTIEDALNAIGDTTKMGWAAGQILAPSQITAGGAAAGQAMIWNGSAWAPGSQAVVTFVTSLPVGPANGDECVYEASAGTVYWRLKYKASLGKWVKIGGPPLTAVVITTQGTASAAPTDLATPGPSITVPLAGLYSAWGTANSSSDGVDKIAVLDLSYNAVTVADSYALSHVASASAGEATNLAVQVPTAIAVGQVIKLRYWASGGGTAYFRGRTLEVDPVYVS